MQLVSHIAIGLFIGILFYYFLGFGFDFVLLVGFAAFLPDIDHAMQFKWNMGNVHRKYLHNIWAMFVFSLIAFILFKSVLLSFGIIIGFLAHMLADSFTVTGVSWLYPYGYEKKFYKKGTLNMSDEGERKQERILQVIFFVFSGFLFISKGISINIFSIDGLVSLAVLFFVGYIIMKKFGSLIKTIIRRLKI